MNPQVKQMWLDALRSGEYQQTTGKLRRPSGNPIQADGYCCLGVLCNLHAEEHHNSWDRNDASCYDYLGDHEHLPRQVIEWAGLTSENPHVSTRHVFPGDVEPSYVKASIAEFNDDFDFTFSQIADLIEEQL